MNDIGFRRQPEHLASLNGRTYLFVVVGLNVLALVVITSRIHNELDSNSEPSGMLRVMLALFQG